MKMISVFFYFEGFDLGFFEKVFKTDFQSFKKTCRAFNFYEIQKGHEAKGLTPESDGLSWRPALGWWLQFLQPYPGTIQKIEYNMNGSSHPKAKPWPRAGRQRMNLAADGRVNPATVPCSTLGVAAKASVVLHRHLSAV